VFCGRADSKLSGEHVFPDWLARYFGRVTVDATIAGDDGALTVWSALSFTQTTRVVCTVCNSGWMADLEGAAEGVLGPMFTGVRRVLRPPQQRTLAFWAAKTALMIDHLDPTNRLVPETHYAEVNKHQSALPNQLVWIGSRASSSQPQQLVHARYSAVTQLNVPQDNQELVDIVLRSAEAGQKLYAMTFSIGWIIFQVFGHNLPGGVLVQGGAPEIMTPIWPLRRKFWWPPGAGLGPDVDVDQFHKQLFI